MSWGDSGHVTTWKWDPSSDVGSFHNLVMSVDYRDDNLVVGRLKTCDTLVRLMVNHSIADSISTITALNAKLIDKVQVPMFTVSEPLLQHPKWTRSDAWNVIDACAGMGVGTHGLTALGMKVVCANDVNPKFVSTYEAMHPGIPTVTGPVGMPSTIARVHSIHPRPAVLVSGFSCQPFSTGGAMQGALDDRALCLPEVLSAAHLLQCCCVVLECVPNAGTNRMVQQTIQTFCQECKFVCSEAILKLSSVWVSRRDRWWAVLTPAELGPCALPPFLDLPYPSIVKHVLPEPLFFPRSDLLQLMLNQEERQVFAKHCPNVSSMLLSRSTAAPTALHSWGSQATGCHCLCRSQGFSDATLAERGLYGILVPLDLHELGSDLDFQGFPAVRHPHPTEVALLNGIVPPDTWPDDLRLVLAGLGQMAAPVHVLWVVSHLQAFLDRFFRGTTQICPNARLDDLRAEVLQVA